MNKDKLKQTILVLAQPPDMQQKLVNHSYLAAEEIILEYADAIEDYFQTDGLDMSQPENMALKALDYYILSKSGIEYQDIWFNPEKLNGCEWRHIRYLADKVLEAFGWEKEVPKSLYDVIYTL